MKRIVLILLLISILAAISGCGSTTATINNTPESTSAAPAVVQSKFKAADFERTCLPELSRCVGEKFITYTGAIDMDNGIEVLQHYTKPKYYCKNCGEGSFDVDVTYLKNSENISSISVTLINLNGLCELCTTAFEKITIPPLMKFFEDGEFDSDKLIKAMGDMVESLDYDSTGKVKSGYTTMQLKNDMKCSIVAGGTSVFALFQPSE